MTTSTASTQNAVSNVKLLLLMTLDPKEIGRRIKTARDERGWSQMDFANEANVSMSTIWRWEKGKLPSVRELKRIAGVLQVDASYLVEGSETATSEPDASELASLLVEVRRLAQVVDENGAKLDQLLQARSQPR